MAWQSPHRSPLVRAAVLGVPLLALGVYVLPAEGMVGAAPWSETVAVTVVLTLLFTAAEFGQVHFEFRRRALSISLSDVPLVLGLFVVAPPFILVARLLGAAISFAMRRRAPSRVIFNSGLFAAEVGVASAITSAWHVPGGPLEPTNWASVAAALLAINFIGLITVLSAISWIDETRHPRSVIISTIISVCVTAMVCVTLGIMAAAVTYTSRWGFGLLAVMFLALVTAHRAYHKLMTRHHILQKMHTFTRAGTAHDEGASVVEVLCEQACVMLHAEQAVMRPSHWPGPPSDIMESGEPLVVPRNTRNPSHRAWLDENQLRDAVIAPIRQNTDVVGVLVVSNRLGEVGTFGTEDLNVLSTLIAHIEVLWHNSSLVEKLRHDALHDPLTGLANRSQLLESIGDHLSGVKNATRWPETPATSDTPRVEACTGLVVLLDATIHRTVHDVLGQQVADMLLIHVASRLDDTLPEDVTIARVGDEEFGVIIPGCQSVTDATEWVQHILESLSDPLETQGMLLEPGACVGWGLLPQDGPTAELALQNAHMALVQARRQKQGNRVARFRGKQAERSLYQLSLAGELRRAISGGQITVVFQPKIAAAGGHVVGFEALARWEHPTRGMIMPDDFISLADRTGQLGPLTACVLHAALDRASSWLISFAEVGVSVNLSARQLLDPELPALVESMLARYQVPAHLLTCEITESQLMSEPESALAAMAELRRIGVRLSIDDFGTGYSSLSYLQTLPIDEVKIDKSFVLPLARDTQNHRLVRAIIDLVHVLGLTVVAEGVENEALRDLLAADGCDVLQGYLIGRGLPADTISQWLTMWNARVEHRVLRLD